MNAVRGPGTIEPPTEQRPSEPSVEETDAPPSAARLILGIAVSLVSVAGVVWWALKQPAPRFPSQPGDLALVGAAIGVYAGATLIRGWRWHVILLRAHIDHRRSDAYALTVVGYMGNTVLPLRGGEVLRILLLGEHSTARKREILGSIIPERILDAAALGLVLIGLTLGGAAGTPAGEAPAIIAAAIILGGLAAGLLYLRLRRKGFFAAFAEKVRPIARASRLLLTPVGAGLLAATVSVWLLEALVFWLVGASLDLTLSLGDSLLVVALASLAGLVPAGPGYVGTYDAGLLFALHAVDVAKGAAVSALILFRFVVFVPITVLGLALMVFRYGGLHRLLRRDNAA